MEKKDLLTTNERIKLLHDNHKEHLASVMRNYAHELHELLLIKEEEIKEDGRKNTKKALPTM